MKVVPIFPGSPAKRDAHRRPPQTFQEKKDALKERVEHLGTITFRVSTKALVTQDQVARELKNRQTL